MTTDTIIIGGGAAGCFAAVAAARYGKSVIVFEPNEKLGRKLRITGKGRCNVTNNCSVNELMENIPVNPRFLYSSFASLDSAGTMEFFEGLGVPLKTERGNRVFPVSDNANDVADALAAEMKRLGVKVIHKRVTKILAEDGVCRGVRAGGEEYLSGSVSPRNPDGTRDNRTVYAHSEEECEAMLAEMIARVKGERKGIPTS